MAKKISYNPIESIHEDWTLDERNGFPYSGKSIQEFIKKILNGKGGEFYYDSDTTKYLIFADTESRDLYLSNREEYADLLLGSFDAPANYTAEINMITPSSNIVLSGTKGCYIDFTFDVKSKSGSSTGEGVVATFTFNNAGNIKKVTQIYSAGTNVHFLADAYLEDGSNSVSVVITGRNTLVSAMAAVNYTVVALQFTSSFDFSKCIISGDYIGIPYYLEGAGVKYVEWYIDGVQLQDVDTISDLKVNRTKSISTSGMSEGKHSVQARAYITSGSDNFYSKTLYFDFVVAPVNEVWQSNVTFVLLGLTLDEPTHSTVSVAAEQYTDFYYKAAVYDSRKRSLEMVVSDNGTQVQSITMYADEMQSLSYFPASVGLHILTFTADGATAIINMDVAVGEVDIQEATEGIALKLSAKGRSNGETNPGTWDYENIHTTFRGFSSWNEQSGWVNDALVIPVGASIEVGFEPLTGNAITTGKTIEIDFEAVNVTDDNAEIMSIENSETHAGLKLTASTAKLLSRGGTAVDTKYRDGDRIHLTFIINKTTGDDARMMYIVNNGILERAAQFAASDSFNAPGNIVIGSNGCVIRVYSIRVYNRALDVDEAFCNYAVDSPNLINIASNNDIYDKDSGNISVDKVSAHIPVMIITGNIDYILAINDKAHKNDWNTNPVQIEFRDMQNPERNFFLDDADIRLQGTSSISYPRKNFRIYSISKSGKYNTKLYSPTHNEGDLIASGKYSFKPRAAAVSCWCLKADYAESSGSHNTGVAKFWNKRMYDTIMNDGTHPLRTKAQAWALDNNYPYDVRTTIDGFPIVLFQRNDENSPLTCLGQYNFNNDKSTEDVFGFTALTVETEQGTVKRFDNSKVECWEVLDSDNKIALFTDVSKFNVVDAETGKKGWEDAFEARYPDKNKTTTALKRVADWINSCYQGMDGETMRVNVSKWRTYKANYFDLPKLAAYYVYLLRFGAVDQTVKNAMFTTEDGQHWFYINYDNDTILGIDNASHLFDTWDYGLKSKTPSGGYYYAGKGMSVLWNLFEADSECMALARQIDERLFAAGLNYEQICEMFDNEQSSKWCERIYNENGRYKYIDQAKLGQNVLYMLQGSRKSHRHWWLFHRLEKYDNEFGNGTYTRRNIQARATSDKNIPEGATYKFVPAINSNFGYGVASTIVDAPTAREAGVEYTSTGLPQATGVGNLIYIYNANNLHTLDVSGYITAMAVLDVSAAVDVNGNSLLRKLVLGDGENDNIYLSAISGISAMKGLEELDIRGYKAITSMEFVNLPNLHKLYAAGSGLTSFTAADGSVFTEITLPETIQSMSFNGSTINSMTCAANKTLVSFSIRNIQGSWDAKSFVNTWLALFTDAELENVELTLVGINWTGMTVDQVLRFAKVGTHTLQGKVTLTSLNYEQYQQILAVYGSNVFDPNGTFVIDAPDGIYFEAPASVTEGQEITLNAIAFPVGNPIVYHLFDSSNAEIQPVDGIATYNGVTLNVNTGVLSVGTISADFTIKLRAVSGESFSELQPCLVRDISTIEGFNVSGSMEFTTTGTHELTIVPTNPNYNVPIQSIEVQAQSMSELLSFTYDVSHLKINVNVSSIPSTTIEQICNIVVIDTLGNRFQKQVSLWVKVIRVTDFTVNGPASIVSKGTYRYNITDLLPANHNKDIASVNVTASPSQGLVITGNTAAGFNLVVTSMPDYTTDVTLTIIATLDNNTTITKTKVVKLKVVSNLDILDEMGVAIQHKNGTFYSATEWTNGGFANADANGVAVSDGTTRIVTKWMGNCERANDAKSFCNTYTFADGSAGRFPLFSELQIIADVYNAFRECLIAIGNASSGVTDYGAWCRDGSYDGKINLSSGQWDGQSTWSGKYPVCTPRAVPLNKPVDLGLPSGRLWSNINLGAASAEDTGLYYQWGNLDGHDGQDGYDFSAEHYAETPGSQISGDIPIANDAAHDTLGGYWHIPTQADFTELFNNSYTTRTWVTINGVSGWRITSKSNGNSIFLPVSGYLDTNGFNGKTTNGFYWSNANNAIRLSFNQSNYSVSAGTKRLGQPIRPVLDPPILVGDDNAGAGTHNYTIENLDNIASISASVSTPTSGSASVSTSGLTTILNVADTPNNDESVTLTVVATLTDGSTKTITKSVLLLGCEYIDLGLPSGLLWCKHNLGGQLASDDGLCFAWGETIGYANSAARNTALGRSDGFSSDAWTATGGAAITDSVLTWAHDAAAQIMGGDWRMPTKEELQELLDNTDLEAVTLNGVNCVKFMKKSDHSVFIAIPAIGVNDNNTISWSNNVAIWSSSYYSGSHQRHVILGTQSDMRLTMYSGYVGAHIRPVRMPVNAIDLGLPSGTLWADKNIGAWAPEDNGFYFAWGEIVGYKNADDRNTKLGRTDGFTEASWTNPHIDISGGQLSSDKDAACQILKGEWRMPNDQEIAELRNNTNVSRVTVNGKSCIKFESKTDASKYIVLPIAWMYDGNTLKQYDSYDKTALARSRQLNTGSDYYWQAHVLSLSSKSSSVSVSTWNMYKYWGIVIRAVQ